MELFDKRFVHFMWDDKLEGQKVFVADNINTLIECIKKGTSIYKVHWSRDTGMPFESDDLVRYRFAYYDPNNEVKKAFNEGKKVQVKKIDSIVDWADCEEPLWSEDCLYRIKPEAEKWIAYLSGGGYLTACKEDAWEMAQEECGAKTKLFIGSENEVAKWYEARRKFTEIIKAWEDGKEIQFKTSLGFWCFVFSPDWDLNIEYRVKPECPCEDGIDSKACVGCEHSEDGKREYKPYVTVDEFIQDYQERFPTSAPRPAYTMPLIWLKEKEAERINLCYAFVGNCVELGCGVYNMTELFEDWTYTDGSPCGKEC